MIDGSRLAFGATTVALVALTSVGTAVLVSNGTHQLRTPNHFSAPRTPQAMPGAGGPVVVPRFPGSLSYPPLPVTVLVIVPVDRPVLAPPQIPEAPQVATPPAVAPPVVEPPVVVPPVVLPPVVPPPPVVEPFARHPDKPHHDHGKHLGQLKH